MKELLTIIIVILALILTPTLNTFASETVNVYLDNELIQFDVHPQIINGRTMVPMRAIFEKLGMNIKWNEETHTVIATKYGVFIELPINSTIVYRNTIEHTIDVSAQLVNGRTLVPVRFVSELAGANVNWDEQTNSVYINSTNNIHHLAWNDKYEYWGEIENEEANGYGALYNISDGTIRQIGKYVNSNIVDGKNYYENGEIFTGNYVNGTRSYGKYYYDNGDSYIGEFSNGQRHGNGTYYYKNGNYLNVNWENGLANGYGLFYNAVENVQIEGPYVDDKRNGDFTIKLINSNEIYYATFVDDIYIDEEQQKLDEKNRKLEEISNQADKLLEEYEKLDEWYNNEMEELYDYIKNGDPFSTEWAKSIYANYGVGGSISVSGLDSYAAANFARQQAALKAKADADILSYNQSFIDSQKQLIEDTYTSKIKILDKQREKLIAELEKLEN